MKTYTAIFRIKFVNSLQYRTAALAGLATQFAWGFMLIFAFEAFYRSNPHAFPMTFSETVSYIWIQQAFIMLFFTWVFDANILDTINTGSISYEMVRPADLYNRWFFQSVAGRCAQALLRCFPILIVAFFLPEPYRLILPPDIGQFVLFLISGALAVGVVTTFSMLVYISVFYTMSSNGIRAVLASIADFLAGAIIPLPFFPPAARAIVELLPFAAMQNMPLRIYSGNIADMDALWGIALQVFWLILLLLFGRWAMGRAKQKVIAQGG
jgi:ABC-2 type transport system permease protein